MLISDLLPIGIAAFAAAILLLIPQRRQLRSNPKRLPWIFLLRFLGLWWAMAAAALLFKLRIFHLSEAGSPFAAVNLIPFRTIAQYLRQRNLVQLGGNALVFFPFPLLLQLNFPKLTRRRLWRIVWAVTALIEPLQLLINLIASRPVNVIDTDDFILNAAGCLLGLCAAELLRRIRHPAPGSLSPSQ